MRAKRQDLSSNRVEKRLRMLPQWYRMKTSTLAIRVHNGRKTFGSRRAGFESAPDRRHPARPTAARRIGSPRSPKCAVLGHFEGPSDNLRIEIGCHGKRVPQHSYCRNAIRRLSWPKTASQGDGQNGRMVVAVAEPLFPRIRRDRRAQTPGVLIVEP